MFRFFSSSLLASAVFLAGCSTVPLPPPVAYTGDALIDGKAQLAVAAPRDRVLWHYRVGATALRRGDSDEAARQLDDALTLTRGRALDPTASQNAMRFCGRIAVDAHYNGLALDVAEGERIARAMQGADVVFLGNHGVVVCGPRIDHAYDDLYYLERACMVQVLAQSTGRPLVPVDAALAQRVCAQTLGERLQSELFFEALRRTV